MSMNVLKVLRRQDALRQQVMGNVATLSADGIVGVRLGIKEMGNQTEQGAQVCTLMYGINVSIGQL